MRELGRSYYPPQPPLITEPDDIVVQATDILFEYLQPNSGITPEEALLRVRSVIDSTAGMAAYVSDAMRPGVGAEVIVAKLAEVLDQHDSDHKGTVSQLLEVVESPLAMEVYDREMERRRPHILSGERQFEQRFVLRVANVHVPMPGLPCLKALIIEHLASRGDRWAFASFKLAQTTPMLSGMKWPFTT